MYGMQVYFKIEKFEKLGPVKDAKPCMPLALFDKPVNLGIVRHKHHNLLARYARHSCRWQALMT